MSKLKLHDIRKGYAEIIYGSHYGYVRTATFIVKTDFEKDEIYKTDRWVPHELSSRGACYRLGRITGYKTRKEAIEAFVQHCIEEEKWYNHERGL